MTPLQREDVTEIVAKQLDVDLVAVVPGARLLEDLRADPVALAQLTLALEERFELFIPDEDIAKLATVSDVVVYVAQRVDAAGDR